MKVKITTDTHLGHQMLIDRGFRPENFSSVILGQIAVSKGDIFLHLGDVCIGNDAEWHEQILEASLGFKKRILVRGNHDNKSYNWYYNAGWDFVCETFRMRAFGKEVLFSHMPILAEETETSLYHKVDKNLHGHLHGRGRYSHRAVDGYEAGFHYDCAPDTHDFKLVDLEKALL